jgi:NADH-quinone oxidoreductase subunit L
MLIGTLALTGFPFLSGFYSKDAIIEFAYLKGTSVGYYVSSVGIFTALLTAIYSWRLFFKTFFGDYNNKSISIEKTHESPLVMIIPLIILAIGALSAGYLFKDLLIGNNSSYWGDTILFLNFVKLENIPIWLIIITPVLITAAIPLSYYIYIKDKTILDGIKNSNLPLYNFLLNKWYVDEIYDFIFVKPLKKIGIFFWKKGDENTIDKFGPDGISKVIKFISNKAIQFQSGYIYDYAFVMLIGLSALITYLILN